MELYTAPELKKRIKKIKHLLWYYNTIIIFLYLLIESLCYY